MSAFMMGSAGGLGGRFMMSGSPGSTPSASAGAPSVTRLSQRIMMGVSGIASPAIIAIKMMRISPILHEMR